MKACVTLINNYIYVPLTMNLFGQQHLRVELQMQEMPNTEEEQDRCFPFYFHESKKYCE